MRTIPQRAALLTAGVACLLGAAVPPVVAQEVEKGSGLGSFSLSANAPAVQVQIDDGGRCGRSVAGTAGCEGVVPESVSTLAKGPIGFALSSVVWPGTLAGNLGSTIILAGGSEVPPEATMLNSPVRAEARTGGDGEPVVYDDVPGARMTAQAVDDEVKAAAEVAQSAAVGAGTFGNSRSSTRTAVTGVASAVSEASSSVSDISIAAGVVTIGSVRSTATATTDGKAATVKGSTVTTGMKIAGVPVEITDEGITVQGTSAPLNKTLSDTVNAAVEQAGMTIALSQPVETKDRGNADYRAGSLVFVWQPQPDQQFTVVLGGAAVSVAAEPELTFDLGDDVAVAPPVDAPALSGGVSGVPSTGEAPVAGDLGTAPDVAAPAAEPVAAPVTAPVAQRLPLPDGIPPVSLVLGLVGAGLFAAGLRRLPDRLLQQAPVSSCVLEGAP